MKKKYLSPAFEVIALYPMALIANSLRNLNSNVNLYYGGASSGDTDARVKEGGWSDIWDE